MNENLSREELSSRLEIAEAQAAALRLELNSNPRKTPDELTNDQLTAIINGPLRLDNALFIAASDELSRRIKGKKQTIDSLFDMTAIRKDTDEVKAIVNDLHERLDKAVKKMFELEERSRPMGIITNDGWKMQFTPFGPETKEVYIPKPGDPYTVDVGHDYTVFRNGTVINWSDDDMIHFAMLCVDGWIKAKRVNYTEELKKYSEKHAKNH